MPTPDPTTLTDLDAQALSVAIHARQVSCREVMQAYLARIHRLNPVLNAIVNLAPDAALLRQADACDGELAQGQSRGWMHGLPQAIKDTGHALGFPSTAGSPLQKDVLPAQDSLTVARVKAAGAIVIGKTNVPELAMGSHTFNPVFGLTANAWDPLVSAGGSSGGAAVALAQRLLPVADGSDLMGSLRNPAAWAHVFGLRPSQGRVPTWPANDVWVAQLGSEGPMARTVRDLALLLSTQAGFDARTPLSIAQGPQSFLSEADLQGTTALRGLRIGWLGDLDGHLAMEDGLLPVLEQALQRCAAEGAVVEPSAAGFDADSVWQAWLVWRQALAGPRVAALLAKPNGRAQIKPEALWEFDQAQGLSFADFMQASELRTAFQGQMLRLLDRFDVLALPVTQVWPFAVDQRWPQAIAGRAMDTYHRWMECTLYATFAGLPAISLPAGFHANGRWPAGLQLIGRPLGEAALLRVAAAYEAASAGLLARRPSEPGLGRA
jgi:amidase